MSRLSIFLVFQLFFCAKLFATEQIKVTNDNVNLNAVDVSSHCCVGYGGNAAQEQYQVQHQVQGQNQRIENSGNSENHNLSASIQGQTANNAGNAQSVSFKAKQYHNTPNLASMFVYPTAPCALPVGATGAGAGFGFGFNTAYINQECVKSETAKLAMALSQPQAAIEVFCGMEHAIDTTVCKELNRSKTGKQASIDPVAKEIRVSQPQASVNEGKKGLFGTRWDSVSQQWVF